MRNLHGRSTGVDRKPVRSALAAVVLATLAACAVGPTSRPDLKVPEHYARCAAHRDDAGDSTTTGTGAPPAAPASRQSLRCRRRRGLRAAFRRPGPERTGRRRCARTTTSGSHWRVSTRPTRCARGTLRPAADGHGNAGASNSRASADQPPGVSRSDRDTDNYGAAVVARGSSTCSAAFAATSNHNAPTWRRARRPRGRTGRDRR